MQEPVMGVRLIINIHNKLGFFRTERALNEYNVMPRVRNRFRQRVNIRCSMPGPSYLSDVHVPISNAYTTCYHRLVCTDGENVDDMIWMFA